MKHYVFEVEIEWTPPSRNRETEKRYVRANLLEEIEPMVWNAYSSIADADPCVISVVKLGFLIEAKSEEATDAKL